MHEWLQLFLSVFANARAAAGPWRVAIRSVGVALAARRARTGRQARDARMKVETKVTDRRTTNSKRGRSNVQRACQPGYRRNKPLSSGIPEAPACKACGTAGRVAPACPEEASPSTPHRATGGHTG